MNKELIERLVARENQMLRNDVENKLNVKDWMQELVNMCADEAIDAVRNRRTDHIINNTGREESIWNGAIDISIKAIKSRMK